MDKTKIHPDWIPAEHEEYWIDLLTGVATRIREEDYLSAPPPTFWTKKELWVLNWQLGYRNYPE